MQDIVGTVAFFKALPPMLFANVLTVTFVYCFAKISQKELGARRRATSPTFGSSMVFLFLLYGLYTWGVYPLKRWNAPWREVD